MQMQIRDLYVLFVVSFVSECDLGFWVPTYFKHSLLSFLEIQIHMCSWCFGYDIVVVVYVVAGTWNQSEDISNCSSLDRGRRLIR
jgi:hypothetical protein